VGKKRRKPVINLASPSITKVYSVPIRFRRFRRLVSEFEFVEI
jgi:hypothetical protein